MSSKIDSYKIDVNRSPSILLRPSEKIDCFGLFLSTRRAGRVGAVQDYIWLTDISTPIKLGRAANELSGLDIRGR